MEDKRVNGTLAVARAIGDFSFKMSSGPAEEQQATPVPLLLRPPMRVRD